MSDIFDHTFTGGAPNTSRNIMGKTGEVTEYNENTEGTRYPLRIANFDNELKLNKKVANQPTYNYYIWAERSRPTNSYNTANTVGDWTLMAAGKDTFTWKYCAYRTGDADDGTTGNTANHPGTACNRIESGISYSCNQPNATGYGDVDGEPGTINDFDGSAGASTNNKINCQDITQLSDFANTARHASKGSNYRPDNVYTHDDTHIANDPAAEAQTGTQEDDVRISRATWNINERVTIGVATRCGKDPTNGNPSDGNWNADGSVHKDFSTKDHIFAWATLRSSASYDLGTQETDRDFGEYAISVSAREKYDKGEELVWISGDVPQSVSQLTGNSVATFSYSGLLAEAEVTLTTACSVKLTISGDDDDNCDDIDTKYAQSAVGTAVGGGIGSSTYQDGGGNAIVDEPDSGICKAEMVTECTISQDNNQDGTDVFDHAGLVDTMTWDVRTDSAIVQALQVSGGRRLQANNVDAKTLMDNADSLDSENPKFNKADNSCAGEATSAAVSTPGTTAHAADSSLSITDHGYDVGSNNPCTPYATAAASQSYPAANKYTCDGDCATSDPYVVLSGFYNHIMKIRCNKMDEYVAGSGDRGNMCHLYGGEVSATEFVDAHAATGHSTVFDTHILEHPATLLVKPPANVPIMYVFGVATWNSATNKLNGEDVNNNENTPGSGNTRRLRTAARDTFANGGTIVANLPRGASAISTIN